jgi:hypothetical protein
MYKFRLFTKELIVLLCLTSMHLTLPLPSSWTVKVVNTTDEPITINIHSSQKYPTAKLTMQECGFSNEEVAPNESQDFVYKDANAICRYPCTTSVEIIEPIKKTVKSPLTSCSNIIVTVSQNDAGEWKVDYADWTDEVAKFVEERKEMPRKVRKMLDQIGDSPIESIAVFRQPIQAGVNELITNLAKNEIKKLNYDDLYHTGFIIKCQDKMIKLERTSTISNAIIKPKDLSRDLEQREIPLSSPITYKEFIVNAMENDPNFWNYHPIRNNCQLFVLQCLTKNDIPVSDDLRAFIYQDAGKVLARNPSLRQFARDVTSLANRIDNMLEKVEIEIENFR